MPWNPSCCSWIDLGLPWADTDGIECTDPIQGYMANNCSVMAALSSIAFVNPRFLNKSPDSNGYYLIKIKNFYKVSSKVCLNQGNNPFAYPFDELWPAIWEKAYAAYLLGMPQYPNLVRDDNQKWEGLCTLNWETNALRALELLTGNVAQPTRTIKTVDGQELIAQGTIIEDIKSYCSECGIGSGSWKVTAAKMVAWTYYNSNSIPPTYTDPPVHPKPYIYNDTISGNHSYVILGLVYDVAGNPYIVLRNPVNVCTPISGAPTTWCGTQNILNGVRGMIAVPIYLFHAVFEAYGWI